MDQDGCILPHPIDLVAALRESRWFWSSIRNQRYDIHERKEKEPTGEQFAIAFVIGHVVEKPKLL